MVTQQKNYIKGLNEVISEMSLFNFMFGMRVLTLLLSIVVVVVVIINQKTINELEEHE